MSRRKSISHQFLDLGLAKPPDPQKRPTHPLVAPFEGHTLEDLAKRLDPDDNDSAVIEGNGNTPVFGLNIEHVNFWWRQYKGSDESFMDFYDLTGTLVAQIYVALPHDQLMMKKAVQTFFQSIWPNVEYTTNTHSSSY